MMILTDRKLKSALLTAWALYRGTQGVPSDHWERDLIVTPFEGCYGIAGYVVTLNGSPPRIVLAALDGLVYSLEPRRRRVLTSDSKSGQPLRQATLAIVEAAEQDARDREDAYLLQFEEIADERWTGDDAKQ
jgi:hypothetical protein